MATVKAVWTFRHLQRALLDRTRARNLGGTLAATVNLVPCAPAPIFLFIALRDGGSLARRMAERPRSGRESGSDLVVGPSRMEINLTFSPLISL